MFGQQNLPVQVHVIPFFSLIFNSTLGNILREREKNIQNMMKTNINILKDTKASTLHMTTDIVQVTDIKLKVWNYDQQCSNLVMLVKKAKYMYMYANNSMVLQAIQPLLVMKTSLLAQRRFYEMKLQDEWNLDISLL